MEDKINGTTETLRYREQGTMLIPVSVTLGDGVLCWEVRFTGFGRGIKPDCFRPVAAEVGLKDFVALAVAEDERVLEFAQSRGILGVSPHIVCTEWDAAGGTFTLRYQEAVSVYKHLAGMAQTMQKVFRSIRGGKPVTMDDIQKLPMGKLLFLPGEKYPNRELTPRDAYTVLLAQAAEWSRAAHSRLVLSGLATAPFPGGRPSLLRQGSLELTLSSDQPPGFMLDWGDWHDGAEWDARQAGHLDRTGWHGKPVFQQDMEKLTPHLPLPDQRPSALFNALAFRLMQGLVLEGEIFWCAYAGCGRPYTLEELYQRQKECQKQQGNGVKEKEVPFPRAPRKDTGGCCSPTCKTAQNNKTWRESKQRKSAKQRKPMLPERTEQ